ncbi:MAG: peroxidase family protein [Synechococcus sp.]
MTNRKWTGRHLAPNPSFNEVSNLPTLQDLKVLFEKQDGKTIESDKSSLLFPYWVQWFTDGFLRVDQKNRRQNTSNHEIDLAPLYGLSKESTDKLRLKKDGKLKSQILNGEEYPLFLYEDAHNNIFKEEFEGLYEPLRRVQEEVEGKKKEAFFAMGVERSNVQIGYVMLNVLCLREHNRLCDLLLKNNPDWDDERLFQTARNTLIVIILKIVVEEYVNHITPYHFNVVVHPDSFRKERWYRTNRMTVEFSLVYRWHSALPEVLQYEGKEMPMPATMWNNELILKRGLGELFEETSLQSGTQIGLFNTPEFLHEVELASIRYGRENQIASYNDYRERCKYPRVTDFDQISSDKKTQDLLRLLYGQVDNIEFYVGLYAEDARPNSAIPLLIERMIASDAFSVVLTNPLLSENVFNKETFSEAGWNEIQSTKSLSDIVNRNVPDVGKKYHVSFYKKS